MPSPPDVSLRMIPVALSPEACALVERLLSEYEDEHALWVEENGEQRGDEQDVALAVKLLRELHVAKGHAEPDTQRATEPMPKPESEAARVADKMAKAARKAVED